MSLLSLVMIVRDEASLLPEFLHHHGKFFDEMVIVDTGSKDESPVIIENSGALCIRHSWNDDFSEARNLGLEKASGKWLMLLDADERIASTDFETIRKFLDQAPKAVYLQKTINYFPGKNHLEWQPVSGLYPLEEKNQTGFFEARRAGLFPNGKGLEFSGRVHESILPAGLKAGLDHFTLDIPVHHYGYVLSSKINRDRQIRYQELVKLKLNDHPDDWAAMLEMASIHLEEGESARAVDLLNMLVHGPDDHPAVNRGRFLLGRVKREEGQLEEARQLLLDARIADPKFLFGWLEGIRLEAATGSWSAVSDLLARARQHFDESQPLLKRENLILLIKTGQITEAEKVARELAKNCPLWQEIQVLAQKLAKMKESGKLP